MGVVICDCCVDIAAATMYIFSRRASEKLLVTKFYRRPCNCVFYMLHVVIVANCPEMSRTVPEIAYQIFSCKEISVSPHFIPNLQQK